MLYNRLENNTVLCCLCPHACKIASGLAGICRVRKNNNGVLNTLNYSKAVAQNIDPIEKKPLYHFFPATKAYSVAAPGCNFKCGFCQNWQISQDFQADILSLVSDVLPEHIVKCAKEENCKSIAYTYTEPIVFFEYMYETAKLAQEEGIKNVLITNGFITQEALAQIIPYLDAVNVDLKSFNDDFYVKNCHGHLKPVLETIKCLKENNVWTEVTTLVIPKCNDSLEELRQIADFIVSIGKEIPWHISRFHPEYHFTDYKATSLDVLDDAFKQAKLSGLDYVYLGNTENKNNTCCAACNVLLVRRYGFNVAENIIENSHCPSCGKFIDGVFN